MNSKNELAHPPEQETEIGELRRRCKATEEKAAKEWEEKRVAMTRQTQEARRGLIETEARRRAFRHLDEVNGRKPEDPPDILDEAVEQYLNGRFFLRELSLFYEVNPHLAMTVFHLRQVWIRQYDLKTVPELLLLDQAMLAYLHVIRTNKKIADLFSLLEDSMFMYDSPLESVAARPKGKHVVSYVGPEYIEKMQQAMLPILDRFNVMFLRNLKALRELRADPIQVNIGRAGQVNVGGQQVNVHEEGAGACESPE